MNGFQPMPITFLDRDAEGRLHSEKAVVEPLSDKLFMVPKDFAELVGVPYNRVCTWIKEGMPVMPEVRSPYRIVVPAAEKWLRNRYGM